MADLLNELNRVISQVDALKGLPRSTAMRASKRIAELIDEQFDAGVDPYGSPWADLAESTIARGRSAPPLTDSGDMRDSVRVVAEGLEITASVDDPFPFHQAGTARMPARPILPFGAVPDTWIEAIDEAVTDELQMYELFRAG